jgi:hypothetical protein
MGEAERRRAAERTQVVDKTAADMVLRQERFALIEEMAATDPEDLDGRLDVRLAELNRLIGD